MSPPKDRIIEPIDDTMENVIDAIVKPKSSPAPKSNEISVLEVNTADLVPPPPQGEFLSHLAIEG